jgi:hypothetical protein
MKTSGISGYRIAGLSMAAVFLLPQIAYANPITAPLFIVPSPVRFILANMIVGALEGLVIGFYNRIEKFSACLMMTAANLFSAFLWASAVEHGPLNASMYWFNAGLKESWPHWTMYFLAAVVLEAPFCGLLLRDEYRPIRQTIKSTILAQAVSYTAIIAWFSMAR